MSEPLQPLTEPGRYFVKPDTAEQAVISASKSKQDAKMTQVVVASVAVIPSTDHLKVKEVLPQ